MRHNKQEQTRYCVKLKLNWRNILNEAALKGTEEERNENGIFCIPLYYCCFILANMTYIKKRQINKNTGKGYKYT